MAPRKKESVLDKMQILVHVGSRLLQGHRDKDDPVDTPVSLTRHIEAVENQKFFVKVNLLENFDFKGAGAVAVNVIVDDIEGKFAFSIEKDDEHVNSETGRVIKQISRNHRGTQFRTRETNEWKDASFTFGKVIMISADEMIMDQPDRKEAAKLGSIKVEAFRTNLRNTPEAQPVYEELPRTQGLLSERVLKGKNMYNRVMFKSGGTTTVAQDDQEKLEPIAGPAGRKYTWTFWYHSEQLLKCMGLIALQSQKKNINRQTTTRTRESERSGPGGRRQWGGTYSGTYHGTSEGPEGSEAERYGTVQPERNREATAHDYRDDIDPDGPDNNPHGSDNPHGSGNPHGSDNPHGPDDNLSQDEEAREIEEKKKKKRQQQKKREPVQDIFAKRQRDRAADDDDSAPGSKRQKIDGRRHGVVPTPREGDSGSKSAPIDLTDDTETGTFEERESVGQDDDEQEEREREQDFFSEDGNDFNEFEAEGADYENDLFV